MQKRCTVCQLTKSVDAFNVSRRRKDGRQTLCRDCSRVKSKEYYQRNLGQHRLVVTQRKRACVKANREKLWSYLLSHPCVDCGETDPVVLEFDHIRDKKENVSKLASAGNSWATVQGEIEKCEVRCANCHRRKTFKDSQAWRVLGR